MDHHFSKHRIHFWNDPDSMMRETYEGYARADIRNIEADGLLQFRLDFFNPQWTIPASRDIPL
ncbi:MAG TPA: hypothetical protein DIC34_13940 [Treponema sp.]|nr:MAG: hypothetical protein A2Y36_14915 [Treponema sp. GWA1_62_8]OHE64778.1 MAG: hypothetical protein A2001_04500 [Treponema sp. GWC1_61_84]OHE71996.1 MAG: hypothetical protein A2413_07440 [Treponema sp. RIFOXYC1_FULL_61_9]HCM27622.1 hypothetical protein [Treponema sp.]